MDESCHLPRFLTRFLTDRWYLLIGCCECRRRIYLTFLTERLRDFFGLNFILHNVIKTSRRSSIRRVSSSFEQIMVVSSMNAFKGVCNNHHGPALSSAAFKITSIAMTNRIGDMVQPMAIPISKLIQSVV